MKKSIKADFALLSCAAIWGWTFVVVKDAIVDISPLLFVALRFSVASVVVFIILAGKLKKPDRNTFLSGTLLGLFLFLGFAFQTMGLSFTSPSRSAFITGLSVLIVPWLAILVIKRVPGLGSVVGIIIASFGLWIFTSPEAGAINSGDYLTAGCALFFGLHIVFVEKFTKAFDFKVLMVIQCIVCATVAFMSAFTFEDIQLTLSKEVIGGILITGLFASALAFYIQNRFQQFTTSTRTALIFATEPVFALIFEYLLKGTTLSKTAIWGALLILSGVVVSELWKRNGTTSSREVYPEKH